MSASGSLFESAAAAVPGIIDVGSRKQLFLDDLLVDEASRVSRFLYRPHKHPGNPILEPDRPWEQGTRGGRTAGMQIAGQAALYDEEERLFKMWYLAAAMSEPFRPWCYAVSEDGYTWRKPELGLYEFEGSTANNIVANNRHPIEIGDNVFKDPHDPDPDRRYKAQGEHEGPIANVTGGAAIAFSPDGLHWFAIDGRWIRDVHPGSGPVCAFLRSQ